MKIYVASSWRNEFQPAIVENLLAMGHEVYDFRNPPHRTWFSWSEISENWQNWTVEEYAEALAHPLAIAGFNSDFDGMKWADCCVMVLPCGRSAHTEAGWFAGQGKPVYVFIGPGNEAELMYKIYDGLITSVDELYQTFHNKPTNKLLPKRSGISLMFSERMEQIHKHGRTLEHDINVNAGGELADAAVNLMFISNPFSAPSGWDSDIWAKMCRKSLPERIIIAGALLAAEYDRITASIEGEGGVKTE